ncbi:MAG TPA: F0F1 ATP synthase subunit A [Candidatus Limnocylindrales bacterium]|nr:F0F1 ATP synthase subunit A [Candidatus Limnocylindrales bacterium]
MFSSLLTKFAIDPVIHITPLTVLTIGGIDITNSMLYGVVCSLAILVLLITVARRMTVYPKGGITQLVEVGTDFITDTLKSALESEEKAVKYAPYFVAIFFFILFSNWLGLLPIVGEAFTAHGEPLTRPFTADLNGTLAAAIITWLLVQYFAIRESGFFRHMRHYFNGSLKNPLTLLLGVFEMFSDLTRIASLALRLFLNVAIGEIIIAVFSALGGLAGPITALPFTILELLVGALQAYIFVMLSIMYLAVAVKHSAHDAHETPEDHLTIDDVVNAEVGNSA